MTINTTGYTVGANQPLNHARILWDHITGTATSDGTGAELAANDYTSQRWAASAGVSRWTLTAASTVALDTIFIAAHNLSGRGLRAMIGGAARTNLLLRSQEFEAANWTKVRSTVTANAITAPDGTATAEKLVETAVMGSHFTYQPASVVAGNTHTFSVFIKAGERGFALVMVVDSATEMIGFNAVVNLATGAITTSVSGAGTLLGSSVEDFGGGWWRVSITGIVTTVTSVRSYVYVQLTSSMVSYTGDGTSGIYVWGAQLEVGAAPTSYIQTTDDAAASDLHAITQWVIPADNTTIAILTNNSGVPWQSSKVSIELTNGDGVHVGIIRAGVALQMQQPFYAGHGIANWSRITEGQQQFSESGQWLGRTEKRIALEASYSWAHLAAPWYRSDFEPFAKTLPLKPFGIAGNPSKMPDDVAWAWCNSDMRPTNMGIRDLVQVSMQVTGYR